MEELYNLGITEKSLKAMIEANHDITILTDTQIREKERILELLDCTTDQIICIISTNPMYLTRPKEEISDLIKCLTSYGFDALNILFDSNPYILNLELFEINNYINTRVSNGELLEDIIDDLDSHPILFNEM